MRLSASVGEHGVNLRNDVRAVQILLNYIPSNRNRLATDGFCGALTCSAIREFQSTHAHLAHPDGLIAANGPTINALNKVGGAFLRPRRIPVASPPYTPTNSDDADYALPKATSGATISPEKYTQMAQNIGCEVAAIKAVVMTETSRQPFDAQGRPTILFERHYFHKLTHGRFDAVAPDISNKTAGGYGKFSAQYGRLEKALKLDRDAALQSASWGAFQIMGANFRAAGCSSVEQFVTNMADINKQADAFVCFIREDAVLQTSIVNKHWTTFARRYNGPKYAENRYDAKLEKNYLIALRA